MPDRAARHCSSGHTDRRHYMGIDSLGSRTRRIELIRRLRHPSVGVGLADQLGERLVQMTGLGNQAVDARREEIEFDVDLVAERIEPEPSAATRRSATSTLTE